MKDCRAGVGRLLAALVLAAAPLALAGCGWTRPAPVSDASTVRAGAAADVPWKALAPTYPKIPEHTIPARPDPAATKAAPPCRASDLRVSSELDAATGGTWILSVHLRSAGPHCRLEGRPTVTVLHGSSPVNVATVPSRGGFSAWAYPGPVLVAPGRPAGLSLTWGKEWCIPSPTVDRVRLDLPGGAGSLTMQGFRTTPGCTYPPGQVPTALRHGSPVVVGTFTPSRFRRARVVSTYDGVRARASGTTRPRTGRTYEFTVTLIAKHDVLLDPCPDYTVEQYSHDRKSSEARYALNCARVPTRDAEGRPYLPAGRPVRFAMRASLVDDPGAMKFLWKLEVRPHLGSIALVKPAG